MSPNSQTRTILPIANLSITHQQAPSSLLHDLSRLRIDGSRVSTPFALARDQALGLRDAAENGTKSPEDVIHDGLQVLENVESHMANLDPGSAQRQEHWEKERSRLHGYRTPRTTFGICGATGAGKSSVLNALLGARIVPTSGMEACTAVPTEISHHDLDTIEADIVFPSPEEWQTEVESLRTEVVDPEGHVNAALDSDGEAAVAWKKLQAVYPTLSPEMLPDMSANDIIALNPRISHYLGTTPRISASDAFGFSDALNPYVVARKRARREAKGVKASRKGKERAARDTHVESDSGGAGELWPLIHCIRIRTNSPVLATGAVLVDLPGVADANPARNQIATEYMKACSGFWVLAPITRAVSDQTAFKLLGDSFRLQLKMDGAYDASSLTFVATKCDDVSCDEIIERLELEDHPTLNAIDERMEELEQVKEDAQTRQEMDAAEKNIVDCQREKDAFCSLARSEWAVTHLQRQFRSGMQEFDQLIDERSQRDSFDPGAQLRDYSAVQLPVFTVSARDYLRLEGHFIDDRRVGCFDSVADTGIPALRDWCVSMTADRRQRTARMFLEHLLVFIGTLMAFLEENPAQDHEREDMRQRWGSTHSDPASPEGPRFQDETVLETRLRTEFDDITRRGVSELEMAFGSLSVLIQQGATKATAEALPICNRYTIELHWATFRAVLRKMGVHGGYNFNADLAYPMLRHIAHNWDRAFSADLVSLKAEVIKCVERLVQDIGDDVSPEMRSSIQSRGSTSIAETRVVLDRAVNDAQELLKQQQRASSRLVEPHVRRTLLSNYTSAVSITGAGSVKIQQTQFRDDLANLKDKMFEDAAQQLVIQLSDAARNVGEILTKALHELTTSINLNMSALWDAP